MKKILFIIFLLTISFSFAEEETIKAQIKYNEATARVEAFKDVERKINKNFYRSYLKDTNRKENIESIKNSIFEIENERLLEPFYIKNTLATYSVTYFDNIEYTFYYNILGSLIKFDKTINDTYPVKTYGYSRYGNLISVTFSVDENEQFIYNETGKLIAHWIGDNMVKKPLALKFINITRGDNPKNTK